MVLITDNIKFVAVCNAGYYNSSGSCSLCTGNTIKSTSGDATDCNTDAACNGTDNIPNTGHTACGSFSFRSRCLK